jgi:hypothetical protein
VKGISDDCGLNAYIGTPHLRYCFASWPCPPTTESIVIDTELEYVHIATAKDALDANHLVAGIRH